VDPVIIIYNKWKWLRINWSFVSRVEKIKNMMFTYIVSFGDNRYAQFDHNDKKDASYIINGMEKLQKNIRQNILAILIYGLKNVFGMFNIRNISEP
jgi:hypothetical protein